MCELFSGTNNVLPLFTEINQQRELVLQYVVIHYKDV